MKIKFYNINSCSVELKFAQSIDEMIGELTRETILFIDSRVDSIYNFSSLGYRFLILPGGERSKSFAQLENNFSFLKSAGADRNTPIAAIGGGAVCDSVSLTASLYKRGLPLTLVPTTLVAQADAALGGKNALNYEGVKNLFGSFYQPQSIIITPMFLASLRNEDYTGGLSECVKTALVASPALYRFMEKNAERFNKSDIRLNSFLARNCADIKMNVVAKDPFDRGLRRILNFGHTLGHAVETLEGMSHGKAVAIGMTFSMLFAEKTDIISSTKVNMIIDLFKRLGLSIERPESRPSGLLEKIVEDKKIGSGKLKFISISDVGKPMVVGVNLSKFKALLNDLHVDWENRF